MRYPAASAGAGRADRAGAPLCNCALLLRDQAQEIALAVVDVEYTGHDREIKQHLLNLLRRSGRPISADRISFQHVGKKSPAHRLAIETLRGERPPDRLVSLEELLAEL